jgi:DNA primase
MGKTYIETIKYLIVADFQVKGLVERPDVIGAVFGQSEGLLGSELDIKELQQNGKIGRIEIEYKHANNTTTGILKLPCSVSMVETAIIGASIETIEKVGPCDAYFSVKEIEDTRGLKRKQIKNRAIDLLGKLMLEQIPDTRELMDEIADTFKTKDIVTIGPEKLPAGPTAKTNNEIIIVEGRADVLNLLKYGITNTIATGGARIPSSLVDLCKNKAVTLFLDGDHGADIQQYQLMRTIKIDFVARAPDGKEVEELTQKEVNQALRRKIKASNINARSGKIKQESIIKDTKFSTTHEHKIVPKIFQESKEKTGKSYFKSGGSKETDIFDQMLSDIPNLERVDLDKSENRYSKPEYSRSNDFKPEQSKQDYSKPDYSKNIKQNYTDRKPMSIKEKIEQTIASMKEKENSGSNQSFKNNIGADKKETVVKQEKDNQEKQKPVQEKQETKDTKDKTEKKEDPKEELKKEPKKELPKLTEDLKKGFLKIVNEIKENKQSRILNEKLRRVANCKTIDLEKKLKNFNPNKAFAVVTSKEPTEELIKIAVSKGIKFLVVKDAKDKNKDVNIVTFKELEK